MDDPRQPEATGHAATMVHRERLRHAVALARWHMLAGSGGPFGALIVLDGVVIAEGWNQVTSANDPTAHAEVVAIRRACAGLGSFALPGAVLYSSCEPCPMCLAAASWARVDRIYFASTRHQAAALGFDDAFLYDELCKAPDDRALQARHLPLPEADEVFAAWLAKPDRVAY